MKETKETQPDIEKNELDKERQKAVRTRKMLKWAVLVSVFTLIAIIAVVIPMALKAAEKTTANNKDAVSTSSAEQILSGEGGGNAAGRPNNRPTTPPVAAPTNPTDAPTLGPTGTNRPTQGPSKSLSPSIAPTNLPTTSPTDYPTVPPPSSNPTPIASRSPTESMSPTISPIDPNYAFKLRLFWQVGYYWQEGWKEDFFCVECTRCDEWGTGDGVEHGCDKVDDGKSTDCEVDDMFWVMECEDRGAHFNIITDPATGGYQIRLNSTELCMTRGAIDDDGSTLNRILRAVPCNLADDNQLWAPFPYLNKFELRPLKQAGKDEGDADCVSQLHHPKGEEVISMHSCKLSRIYETRYWEEWQ